MPDKAEKKAVTVGLMVVEEIYVRLLYMAAMGARRKKGSELLYFLNANQKRQKAYGRISCNYAQDSRDS